MRGGAGTPVFARFENVRALRRMLENARRNGMTDAVAAIERRIAELEERARPWFLNTAEEYVRLQRAGNPHANRGRLIQMLGRHGAVESISLLATRPEATAGFEFLRLHGRLDISFERFVADNPAMFDEEVVAVASVRLAVVRAGAVPNPVTATAPQISPTAGDVEERGAARGVGRWWAADSAERYWLEATDRDDIGSDLRAPELDGGGRPNWRYGLFKEARPGDVVLHYDKDRGTGGIVGFSRIAGPWTPAPIVWAARGTFARERGDVPEERPGYVVPLEGFTRFATPLTLARLRERTDALREMQDDLARRHAGAPLYFPFETAGSREVRLLQGYAFKLPAAMLRLFPELAGVASVSDAPASPTTPVDAPAAPGALEKESSGADDEVAGGRNPPWTREELILALDLYLRQGGGRLSKTDPELEDLSDLLNQLHRLSARGARPDFRNPAGCYMRLMNFRRFDPEAQARGSAGLARGSQVIKERRRPVVLARPLSRGQVLRARTGDHAGPWRRGGRPGRGRTPSRRPSGWRRSCSPRPWSASPRRPPPAAPPCRAA